jgi:Uma2 family endonuclease
MAYEEFLDWAPDGLRSEWTDGEGIIYMTAGDRHQALILLLASTLDGFVRLFGLGRVSLASYPMKLWPEGPHREPDVLFVASTHLDRWTEQRLHGPDDFVLDVLSEDTAGEDQDRKRRQYEAIGIPEYVMIDARPGRHEFVFLRLDEDGRYQPVQTDDHGRYHSAVLPGFWLRPAWFREDPLPRAETLLLEIAPDAYEAWLLAEIQARRQGQQSH